MNFNKYYLNAFTLIELMVSIAIAAILIAIAVPSFTDFYDNSRSEAASSNIQQSFITARSHAISYGATVSLCPVSSSSCGTDWINGYDIFIDVNSDGTFDSSDDQIIRSIDAFNSNDFIKTSLSTISFSAEGMVTGSAASASSRQFIYCPSSKTNSNAKGIDVSTSGKISLSTGSVNCS
ncbi:GspH/FimT family protein [Shewanella abyssi]|uniref:GspH/FimT family pseudopilin n=1 Tax=Shewanella abyssi TaxID=311789 RepID=UPI0020106807|nr:GspH/FimT family protein [Shewanella abyssi]MCL1051242.1 GspH/FimT family protein [Shewanella abyssi]